VTRNQSHAHRTQAATDEVDVFAHTSPPTDVTEELHTFQVFERWVTDEVEAIADAVPSTGAWSFPHKVAPGLTTLSKT
jgi:hypothetical protein